MRRIVDAGGFVVDAGGGEPFTKDLARYKPWFEAIDYRTLDVSKETGPDIVADIHALPSSATRSTRSSARACSSTRGAATGGR